MLAGHVRGVVGGAVVDDDDLGVRQQLAQPGQRPAQALGLVLGRQDDGNSHAGSVHGRVQVNPKCRPPAMRAGPRTWVLPNRGICGKVLLDIWGKSRMNAATANLVGITGITRRLVLDGVLSEADARRALDEATKAKKQAQVYLLEQRLVSDAQIAAANSTEFGMPLFDAVGARPHVLGGQDRQRGPDPEAPGPAAVPARQPPVRRGLRSRPTRARWTTSSSPPTSRSSRSWSTRTSCAGPSTRR